MLRLSFGSSTRSVNASALRGSKAFAAARMPAWYSSWTSWRFRNLARQQERRVRVEHGHRVNLVVDDGECRSVKDDQVRRMSTRLPDGVDHSVSRYRYPPRKSRRRGVPQDVGLGQDERLVVDVQPDHLGVRRVDDGLPGLGEAERVLGVPDRPRLVEAVDVRAVLDPAAALVEVAAEAQVPVADGEVRLRDALFVGGVLGLDERPLVHRVADAVQGVGGDGVHAVCSVGGSAGWGGRGVAVGRVVRRELLDELVEVADDDVGAVRAESVRAGAAVDADDQAEGTVRPASTPLVASSTTTHSAAVRPRRSAASRYVSGAGLPARPSCRATSPSTTTGKRSRMPAVRSTWVAFAELDTTATCTPASIAAVRKRREPGYGSTPCSVSSAVNSAVVLAVPEPAHRVGIGGVVGGALRQLDAARGEQRADPS